MTTYGEDLAYVHDAGFGDVARAAARVVGVLLPRGPRVVVDVGCGSGIAARELLRRGREVVAIEPSLHLLALARRNAPSATLRRGSFATARLPPCDAVLATGEVLCYATERGSSWAAVRRFFTRAHAALRPGGVLVFDIASPGRVPGGRALRTASGRDWLVVSESVEARDGRSLTRRITTFRRIGRLWRRSDEVHRLRLYRPADVLAALRGAGFGARRLPAYPGLAPQAGWHAFAGRRR